VRGREFLNVLIIDAGAAIDRQRANYSTDRLGIESHGLEGFPDLLRIDGPSRDFCKTPREFVYGRCRAADNALQLWRFHVRPVTGSSPVRAVR
jgi:hypothetical protein